MSNEVRSIISNVLSEYRDRFYVTTYLDGKRFLGRGGTVVLLKQSEIDKGIDIQTNKLKHLKDIKPFIGHSSNITLRVIDLNDKELKTIDVTDRVKEATIAEAFGLSSKIAEKYED